jgi:hypothetical protein
MACSFFFLCGLVVFHGRLCVFDFHHGTATWTNAVQVKKYFGKRAKMEPASMRASGDK